MKQNDDLIFNNLEESNFSMIPDSVSIDANDLPNAVLKRLIEEVKYENHNNISAYNRTHSRHNRGR